MDVVSNENSTSWLSDANLIEAWARVRANQGCAGIDGQTLKDFEAHLMRNLAELRNEIHYQTYRPRALLGVEISKKTGGKRSLAIPAVRDRVIQTATALVLTPVFEAEFEECSFAYRRGRSVDQAIQKVRQLREQGYCWVVDADIDSFFDEINHQQLLQQVRKLVKNPTILKLIEQWLNAEVVDGNRRYRRNKGVPQGSPISPLLSNLYLDHLDEVFQDSDKKLIRFADDFLVLCKNKKQAEAALELSNDVLHKLQLKINKDKTHLTSFNQGFRFLGVQFIRSLMFKKEDVSMGLGLGEDVSATPAAARVTGKVDQSTASDENEPAKNLMAEAFADAGIKPDAFTPVDVEPEPITPPDEEEPDLPEGGDPRLRTLYLFSHEYTLAKASERLLVKKDDEVIKKIPAIKVDQVMVFGNSQITTQAMQLCLTEHIPIYLLSAHGRYHGVIDAFDTDPILLHRDQFIRAADPAFCLSLAKTFIKGKIANSRVLLQRYARRGDNNVLNNAIDKLKTISIDEAISLEQLRGFEGSAARCYFSALGKILPSAWQFNKRVRQPPTDPVNAMLSYGYTLLYYNVYTFLRARGLNPHVGYLHPMRAGHPALASDVMEEFRSIIVDAVILKLVISGKITVDQFEKPTPTAQACMLNKEARKIFIQALEKKFNATITHPGSGLRLDYRRCVEQQIKQLTAVIRGREDAYQPMVLR